MEQAESDGVLSLRVGIAAVFIGFMNYLQYVILATERVQEVDRA